MFLKKYFIYVTKGGKKMIPISALLTLSKFPEFEAFLPVQGNIKKHCHFFRQKIQLIVFYITYLLSHSIFLYIFFCVFWDNKHICIIFLMFSYEILIP